MRVVLAHGGSDRPFSEEHLAGVRTAALEGFRYLDIGVVDAVEKAVNTLEGNPLYNSGYGGELNLTGQLEMDAAVVDGRSGRCGFVTAIQGVKHPVSVARRVMEKTPHVILSGQGASEFARAQCFPPFHEVAPERRKAWEEALNERADRTPKGGDTVGCVAVFDGIAAAASSTGGIVMKMPGRVGDTGVLGGGILANRYGAAVCTGVGEAFIRVLAASNVLYLIQSGADVSEAVHRVLTEVVLAGGIGAIVAVDATGKAAAFCSTGKFPLALVVDGQVVPEFVALPL